MPSAPCLECRRRKIGCNRCHPCSYCVRSKIQCVYPDPPAVALGSDSAEKMEFLHRRVDGVDERVNALERHMNNIKQLLMDNQSKSGNPRTSNQPEPGAESSSRMLESSTSISSNQTPRPGNMLNSTSENDEAMFSGVNLLFLSQIFLERVDPLIKIIHLPSTQSIITRACKDIRHANLNTTFLIYAISYAAFTSMSSMECISEFQQNRVILLIRSREKINKIMSQLDILNNTDMGVLQGLVLYLVCGRLDEQGPNTHGLIGMVIGKAIKMQLNRDGDKAGVSPFESEMRRRLWWHILTLDAVIAQDKKTDPCVLERSFTTRIPFNVSDSQLDPDMSKLPADRLENSEMTFTLCKFTTTFYLRQLMFSAEFCRENLYPELSAQDKIEVIGMLEKQIESQYLQYSDESVPLQKFTTIATRLNLLKMKLMITDQSSKRTSRNDPDFIKDCARYTEYLSSLRTCQKGSHFLWFFKDLLNWSL